jgi:tetratricopeptide (TPR) repeat protein
VKDFRPEDVLAAIVGTTGFASQVLSPMMVELNLRRAEGQSTLLKLGRVFVIPMIAAGVVSAISDALRLPEVLGGLAIVTFVALAMTLGIQGNRKARRRRLAGIAEKYDVDVERVTELDAGIVRDARLLLEIKQSVTALDGRPFSSDLGTNVAEALAAAMIKTELFERLVPGSDLESQLQKVRVRKESLEKLGKDVRFNPFISTGVAVFGRAEEVLLNRRDMMAVCEQLRERYGHRVAETGTPAVGIAAPMLSARELFDEGRGQFQARNFHASRASFEKVLAEVPAHPNAQFLLGASLLELGQIEESIRILRKAVEAQPEQPDFRNTLGMALGRLGHFDEGEVHMARAAFLGHPQAREVLANTGMDYCRRCAAPHKAGAVCSRCSSAV